MPTFHTIEKDFQERVKGDCFFDEETRHRYSTAACWYQIKPIGVVFPRSVEDVQNVLAYCYQNEIAVIPRGAATGLAGQAIGMGIILDFTRYMNELLSVDEDRAKVQPGMIYSTLNEKLQKHGKFFPIDPTSGNLCTIGGMIGTNAAGYHGIKYGATKDHIDSIEVVLANGEFAIFRSPHSDKTAHEGPLLKEILSTVPPLIMQNKSIVKKKFPAVPKNSSGYDLLGALESRSVDLSKIVIGSEGTLAVVVGATLNLSVPPRNRVGALAYFADYDSTIRAVLSGSDLQPSAIEILDHSYVSLVRGVDPLMDALIVPSAKAMLYFEFEGDDLIRLQKNLAQLNRALSDYQMIKFLPLTTQIERKSIWQLREHASRIINYEKSTGKTSFVEDVTVPLEQLQRYIDGLGKILMRHGIEYSIYGHAGVGNIHCAAFVDLKRPDHYRSVDSIASEVADLAISLGGTLSGEHGDGFVRTPFLERLYGPEIYDLFKKVKNIFDHKNILNPGKIIGNQNATILHDLQIH